MKRIAIGADISGSHITFGLFDFDGNQMENVWKVRMLVDSRSPKENILSNWGKAI